MPCDGSGIRRARSWLTRVRNLQKLAVVSLQMPLEVFSSSLLLTKAELAVWTDFCSTDTVFQILIHICNLWITYLAILYSLGWRDDDGCEKSDGKLH